MQRTSLLKHIGVISFMGLSEFFRGSAKRRVHRALVRGIHLIEPVACTHSFQFLLTLHQSETTENRAPKDKALKHQSKENSKDVLTKQNLFFTKVSPLGCGCDPSIGVLQNIAKPQAHFA